MLKYGNKNRTYAVVELISDVNIFKSILPEICGWMHVKLVASFLN